jgi:hypothetical protein
MNEASVKICGHNLKGEPLIRAVDAQQAIFDAVEAASAKQFSDGVAALACHIINNGEEIPEEQLQEMVNICIEYRAYTPQPEKDND